MALLIDNRKCPIPAKWVHELSHLFVGDLSTKVVRTGVFMSSVHCPWELQLPMFKCFSIPIWVHIKQDTAAFDTKLCHYNSSPEAIACAIEAQTPSNNTWGQSDDWNQDNGSGWGQDDGVWGKQNGTQNKSAPGWDTAALGWDDAPMQSQTVPEAPQVKCCVMVHSAPQVEPCFLVPERNSGQKPEEDWKTFFAQHLEGNQKKQEKESLAQQQTRESQEWAAKSHNIPGKSSTATVFEWQPQDEFGGFLLCIRLTKAEVPMTWGNYNNSTRLYNSFQNEWDLCDQLDPTSTPDGNWEEDQFNFSAPIPDPQPPPPPAPPLLSSFLQDICNYFGHHEVAASSSYTEGVEQFVTHLCFHLGFHMTASNTRSIGGSATFESWVKKQKFSHICNIVRDSGKDVDSISDMQKHPSQSRSLVPWKLVVPDAATAVMCLCCDWGSNVSSIALKLLQKGIAFKTLQFIAVSPDAWHPLSELRTFSLGYFWPPFKAIYANYITYE
ncbi:hypothetical protein BDR04DRAFT_1149403 [Suillus decipiens]|nr:hypothetical protein BDR04DRAFT_1149403 [Suillus decipiens]